GQREFWTPNFIGLNYRVRREPCGGTHAGPRFHWRKGHWTHQPIGDFRGNPDFVPASALPRLPDGRIHWEAVEASTRDRFWSNHQHRWIEPLLIDEGNGA